MVYERIIATADINAAEQIARAMVNEEIEHAVITRVLRVVSTEASLDLNVNSSEEALFVYNRVASRLSIVWAYEMPARYSSLR